MLEIRKSNERGHAVYSWLESRHTFSFAGYHDPHYTGFRDLRVINEDTVAPASGFDPHHHRDMAILTYVLEGSLTHQDDMGNRSTLHRDDFQLMHAGKGILHSEYNLSNTDPLHFMQIWVIPNVEGMEPEYEERSFRSIASQPGAHLVASPDGVGGSLRIHQDMKLYLIHLDRPSTLTQEIGVSRYGWFQVMRGAMTLNGLRLNKGDGIAVGGIEKLDFCAEEEGDGLLFDLN